MHLLKENNKKTRALIPYMSKSTLAVLLSKLKRFENPKMHLEQYPTPSEIAATILWDAHCKGLIEDKLIVDLGAGTGILGIGALILGAKEVQFIEIDKDAQKQIEENITLIKEYTDAIEGTWSIVEEDITAKEFDINADLVISNPPFGTKQKHVDTSFLKQACSMGTHTYTFHKTATQDHIMKKLLDFNKPHLEIFPFSFNLPPTMKAHNKTAHHVEITCFHAW